MTRTVTSRRWFCIRTVLHGGAWILLAPLLSITAAGAASPDLPSTFVLEDGTEVGVGVTGAISVRTAGRTVFESAPTAVPEARRFNENIVDKVGTWEFTILSEERIPLSDVRRVRLRRRPDSHVAIKFRSEKRDKSLKPRREKATLIIEPNVPGESTRLRLEVRARRRGTPISAIAIPIRCDQESSFYGFGAQYNAANQRGEVFSLMTSEQGIGRVPDPAPGIPALINGDEHTTYFPMPYYLDARGFGLLAKAHHRTTVDLCSTDSDIAWLEVIDDEPMELLVFHGPEPKDVIRQLGDEVGRPQSPPEWAWSPWISAQGGQAAILAEAQALRSASIPAGALWVQDWTGIPPDPLPLGGSGNIYYRWETDTSHYPDLPGLVEDVKALGFRWLGYVNPFVDVDLQHYQPMRDAGLLLGKFGSSQPYEFLGPLTVSALPDLTLPAAREFVKGYMRLMVTEIGMDGWMSDYAEWAPLDAVYSDGSDPRAMHNRYPELWHRLWREVMDELRPDGDFVVFSRAGWTGVHRDAMVYWIGDQQTTWDEYDGIRTVIPAMLNLGISGIPFVTHDLGGYSSYKVPVRSKELFLRWTELAAFTPIMRTHEGEFKEENWSWDSDAETTAHFRRFSRIHNALGAEFEALAEHAATTSVPMLRHLMLEFPDDPGSLTITDQYLIGDSLLVAPVLDEGVVARDVYLPPGPTWYDVWTGIPYAGGQTVFLSAPIGSPPVFSRDADRSDLRAITDTP